jgi:hypothetical protein
MMMSDIKEESIVELKINLELRMKRGCVPDKS